MTNRRHALAAGIAFSLSLALGASAAFAQAKYPSKTIRWVVPVPAGAPQDSIARKLAETVSRGMGATIIIDNKPGASGTIGAAEVARAAPDGYTFMFSVADPLIGALAVFKSLPYEPRRDFTFITKVANSGPLLVAHPSIKANTLPELIAELKTGKKMSYGSWGPGTMPTQVIEAMAQQAGVAVTEVAYKGFPPALQDLLGGHVALTFVAPHLSQPLVAENKIKPFAVVSAKRSTLMPNVPTFAELGYTGFVFTNEIWVGLTGPAKMDPAIRDHMAQAVQTALREPVMSKFLSDIGFMVVGNSPAEFERQYRAEVEVVPRLMRERGVVAE